MYEIRQTLQMRAGRSRVFGLVGLLAPLLVAVPEALRGDEATEPIP